MRKISLVVFSVLLAVLAQSQTDNKIVIGTIDSVYSKILSEPRKIWVYTPDMTSGNKGQRWPVLYLLDGDGHFPSVVGMIHQMSQVNGNNLYPEMIVVAIPNTDRTRDLTPTHVVNDLPMMDSNFSKTSGGGENFVAFIEKELMPHIDSLYPTAPYRLLIGHSFGGLTVMNVLANHAKLFNAYIAIDPSMWYDKQHFLEATETKLAKQNYDGTRLFIGIANTMPEGMTLAKMKKDTSSDTRHIRSIFSLDAFLKSHPPAGLKYASKYYGDDNHGSVPLISEYDGLRFIFGFYRLTMTSADFNDTTGRIAKMMNDHYKIVSKEMGYQVLPPELSVNGLGYFEMSQKRYTTAAALFKMNIENFPKSGNTYDSYGDLLAAQKDTAGAIANYKKALALQDNAATIQKLNALEGKEVFKVSAQDLQKYAGVFELDSISVTITMDVREDALWAAVPGQGDFQLIPLSPGTFSVKNLSGYLVTFQMEGDKAIGFTSVQPNGTFKARLKK